MIVIKHYLNIEPPSRLTVTIVENIDRLRPNPNPPEDIIPKGSFRCFVCQQIKGKKQFGDIIRDKKVCRECYHYVTDWGVGCSIKWDRSRGFDA